VTDQRILDAVISAIMTERQAMMFYRRAALRMQDKRAREIFEQLAREELEHAKYFLDIYQGDSIPGLAEQLLEDGSESEWMLELAGLLDGGFDDAQALQLAMLKEKHLERQLRHVAGSISDPAIRNVYEVNAESTRQHFIQIEEEYKRLTGRA